MATVAEGNWRKVEVICADWRAKKPKSLVATWLLSWACGLAIADVLGAATSATVQAFAEDSKGGSYRFAYLQFGELTNKVISPLLFGANVEFFQPALADGVTKRQQDFSRALRDSGISALRFPGGTSAYFYLPESPELTMKLAQSVGVWSFRQGDPFVTLEQLADFCQRENIQIIYELPCLFYLDGDRSRAIIRSGWCDANPSLFDRNRIDEGVAYGMKIVRRLRDLGAPVVVWELGNEEFGYTMPEDYAEVATAYAREIRRLDPETPIVADGMEGHIGPISQLMKNGGPLVHKSSLRGHYPFGNWPQPPGEDRRGDPYAFVSGDLRVDRWMDVYADTLTKLGIEHIPVSITETTVMHHEFWDAYAVIGTHAHALCYAWNWMELLQRPEVDIAVFHDLCTPFFGIMRYNVGFDHETRHFVGASDPKAREKFLGRYVLSPTGYANRLLGALVGEKLITTNLEPTSTFRVLASRNHLVVVNRGENTKVLGVPFARAKTEVLTADGLDACLPGSFRIGHTKMEARDDMTLVVIPPWCVALITRVTK